MSGQTPSLEMSQNLSCWDCRWQGQWAAPKQEAGNGTGLMGLSSGEVIAKVSQKHKQRNAYTQWTMDTRRSRVWKIQFCSINPKTISTDAEANKCVTKTSLKPNHMWWLVFIKLQGLHNRYLLIGSVGSKEWTEIGQRESSYSHNFNSEFKFAIWGVGGVQDIKCIWKKLQNMFAKYKYRGARQC